MTLQERIALFVHSEDVRKLLQDCQAEIARLESALKQINEWSHLSRNDPRNVLSDVQIFAASALSSRTPTITQSTHDDRIDVTFDAAPTEKETE